MEIIFAATLGQDGRKIDRSRNDKRKKTPENELPLAKIGLIGFAAIVVMPVLLITVFRPDVYDVIRESATGENIILSYASRQEESFFSQPVNSYRAEQERLLKEALTRKQQLFLAANLGELSLNGEYIRKIPATAQARPCHQSV